MTAVSFTVHGTAQPAGSKRGFVNKRTQRVIITDANKKSAPWKGEVTAAAAKAMNGRDLLEGPLSLVITFWVTRPLGHHGTGKNAGVVKASAPWAPTVKPDLLKLARGAEDALTGVVYRDDAQIVAETLQKAYTTGSARADIHVAQIQPPARSPIRVLKAA